MLKLTVEKRDSQENLDSLRRQSKVPAVFYGKKEAPTSIKLNLIDFKKALKTAGESSVIELVGDGIEVEVLIQDYDLDPVTSVPIHVDFYVIEKGKKLEVGVPLEFVGIAPAVKELGAVLVKVLHEIEIESLPKDLPHKLDVDISTLVNFDSVITAGQIVLPAGVTLVTKAEEVIASVYEPKEEVVETAPIDLSSIEVEKKGKEAKEGAPGEADSEAPADKTEKK